MPANEQPATVTSPTIPNDALIIVPVRNIVLFPGVVAPITIARPKSIAAAQQALREQRPVGIVLQRNTEAEDPCPTISTGFARSPISSATSPRRMKPITSSARAFSAPAFSTFFPARHSRRRGCFISRSQ